MPADSQTGVTPEKPETMAALKAASVELHGFRFSERNDLFDWKLLHGVEPDAVVKHGDLSAVEDCLSTLQHGSILNEKALSCKNCIQVFRLLQLAIEYLQHLKNAHGTLLTAYNAATHAAIRWKACATEYLTQGRQFQERCMARQDLDRTDLAIVDDAHAQLISCNHAYHAALDSLQQQETKVRLFHFRKQSTELDWQQLCAVDVDALTNNLDFNTLEKVLPNLMHGRMSSEDQSSLTPHHFTQIIPLAQCALDYVKANADASGVALEQAAVSLQVACADIPTLTIATQDMHTRVTNFTLQVQQDSASLIARPVTPTQHPALPLQNQYQYTQQQVVQPVMMPGVNASTPPGSPGRPATSMQPQNMPIPNQQQYQAHGQMYVMHPPTMAPQHLQYQGSYAGPMMYNISSPNSPPVAAYVAAPLHMAAAGPNLAQTSLLSMAAPVVGTVQPGTGPGQGGARLDTVHSAGLDSRPSLQGPSSMLQPSASVGVDSTMSSGTGTVPLRAFWGGTHSIGQSIGPHNILLPSGGDLHSCTAEVHHKMEALEQDLRTERRKTDEMKRLVSDIKDRVMQAAAASQLPRTGSEDNAARADGRPVSRTGRQPIRKHRPTLSQGNISGEFDDMDASLALATLSLAAATQGGVAGLGLEGLAGYSSLQINRSYAANTSAAGSTAGPGSSLVSAPGSGSYGGACTGQQQQQAGPGSGGGADRGSGTRPSQVVRGRGGARGGAAARRSMTRLGSVPATSSISRVGSLNDDVSGTAQPGGGDVYTGSQDGPVKAPGRPQSQNNMYMSGDLDT